jgi:predicted transcriptional regulator
VRVSEYFQSDLETLKKRGNLARRYAITLWRLPTKSEFSPSAITIDIHLLEPDVGRRMAEFKECPLEWSWINQGTRRWG